MNYNRDQKGRLIIKKETSIPFERSGAFFTIERKGQQKIEVSDEVRAELTIHIPAINSQIKDELMFNDRCEIMDCSLYDDWGNGSLKNPNFRFMIKYFFGTKWVDVFEEARKYATSEINKLEKMLENRENALKDAEY